MVAAALQEQTQEQTREPEIPEVPQTFRARNPLTADGEVRTIIAQAVTQAVALGVNVTVVVTDRGGTVLGAFRMTGAPKKTRIEGTRGQGLEGSASRRCTGGAVQGRDGGVLRHFWQCLYHPHGR